MVRPFYETHGDLQNEKQVVDYLATQWDMIAFKLPIRYNLDFAFFRGNTLVALAEIKCRTFESTKYPTCMICATKRMHAIQLSQTLGVPALLIYRFTDSIKYIDFGQIQDEVKLGGRKDRNDPQDMGIMIHYNLDRMKDV